MKDFLRPVSFSSVDALLASVPVASRDYVVGALLELVERLDPPPALHTAAVLAEAVRASAAEDFRSLLTFNTNPEDWPASRDDAYVGVLGSLLGEALLAPTFDLQVLYENLVAMAALEETMGVREPRAACAAGYSLALSHIALQLLGSNVAAPADLSTRVQQAEQALGMILRLPDGIGPQCRLSAFKSSVNWVIDGSGGVGKGGLKEIEGVYPKLAEMLQISASVAAGYVNPLGQAKFDKFVGSLLMNADLAVTIPEMGPVFRQQVNFECISFPVASGTNIATADLLANMAPVFVLYFSCLN